MIGIYNYTVILTYLSVASAVAGIGFAMNEYPYYAVVCLMLSGLFDMFDGKVARLKKERSEYEINYGTQIDSLADVIAFGVLPVVIGFSIGMTDWFYWPVGAIFVLAALIRLAHFNVVEELNDKQKKARSKTFEGLPTTSVALILPLVIITERWVGTYFPLIWAIALIIIATLFVLKSFKLIDKPDDTRKIIYMLIGIVELIAIGTVIWLATR